MKIEVQRSPMIDTGSADSDKNDEFVQQLGVEFRDFASDLLSKAEALLEAGRNANRLGGAISDSVYRKAHCLKGPAASCGHSLTGFVAHRAEDYLADEKVLNEKNICDIQQFFDTLGDLFGGKVKQRNVNASQFVRALRSRPTDFGDVSTRGIKVLVVMPDYAVARHAMRELQACGYRVTCEGNSFKTIKIASVSKPDLVIVTGVLDMPFRHRLTSAFRTMPSTKDIPVALITADTRDDVIADDLPKTATVIRKGSDFGEDLTDALTEVDILSTVKGSL